MIMRNIRSSGIIIGQRRTNDTTHITCNITIGTTKSKRIITLNSISKTTNGNIIISINIYIFTTKGHRFITIHINTRTAQNKVCITSDTRCPIGRPNSRRPFRIFLSFTISTNSSRIITRDKNSTTTIN